MVKMFFIKKSSRFFFGFLLMRSTNQTKQPNQKKAERNETEGLNWAQEWIWIWAKIACCVMAFFILFFFEWSFHMTSLFYYYYYFDFFFLNEPKHQLHFTPKRNKQNKTKTTISSNKRAVCVFVWPSWIE